MRYIGFGGERHGAASRLERLIALADTPQCVTQVAEYLRIVRLQGEGASIAVGSVLMTAKFQEGIAQVVLRLDFIWVELQGRPVERNGLRHASQCARGIAGIHERAAVIRLQRNRSLQAQQGGGPLAAVVERRPEVAMGFGVQRQELGGAQ